MPTLFSHKWKSAISHHKEISRFNLHRLTSECINFGKLSLPEVGEMFTNLPDIAVLVALSSQRCVGLRITKVFFDGSDFWQSKQCIEISLH